RPSSRSSLRLSRRLRPSHEREKQGTQRGRPSPWDQLPDQKGETAPEERRDEVVRLPPLHSQRLHRLDYLPGPDLPNARRGFGDVARVPSALPEEGKGRSSAHEANKQDGAGQEAEDEEVRHLPVITDPVDLSQYDGDLKKLDTVPIVPPKPKSKKTLQVIFRPNLRIMVRQLIDGHSW